MDEVVDVEVDVEDGMGRDDGGAKAWQPSSCGCSPITRTMRKTTTACDRIPFVLTDILVIVVVVVVVAVFIGWIY